MRILNLSMAKEKNTKKSRDSGAELQDRLHNIRHSLAHLLAAAVLKKFPDAELGIGPVIEDGFYYDFKVKGGFTPEDLKEFEKSMRKMIGAKLPFSRKELKPAELKKFLAGQPFKKELYDELKKDPSASSGQEITFYETGDVFLDLCRGGHVENTSEIDPDSFKLDKIAGAYWRSNEKNPQMQRIYGLAFETKKDLDAHLAMLAEAKKRDHKVLGPALDLFTFSDLVGSGLPLWTPRGTLIRDMLDAYVWEMRRAHGYERVDIPHITKKDLYEKSGHWEKFKDELFKITTREGHIFAMKPMNCPHHTQIYARKQWSYRELPQRYASTTKVYRDEQSGELAGLSRVRSITQDDAHVFCRKNDIEREMSIIWDIIEKFYKIFGFRLAVRLSLSDPEHQEKYLGTPELWKEAESTLRNLAIARSVTTSEAPGEAAFYGPKIDFITKDSLGRTWQVATIQLDMNMPERFDLYCVNEGGKQERIVMIHAAIMGSIERFTSILIEHTGGHFPLWLAPTQAVVVPISETHKKYAEEIRGKLAADGIRAVASSDDLTLGKRIRAAETQKIPYILVVGDREVAAESASVRHSQKGDLGTMKIEELRKKLNSEIEEKIYSPIN